ncbi:uncharacterized protein TNCV_41461 [Trichonephila clavipes]|nr:uncharacterized protein TNCV_41461 [Trichonephila clavipes]
MAPGSRCMSGYTCGCRMSWTYCWTFLVPRINIRGDRVFLLVIGTTPNGGIKGSTRNGRRDPKCPSSRLHRMVREDTGAPIEGATYAWMAADEAFGGTRAFLTMWRSSRRLVC